MAQTALRRGSQDEGNSDYFTGCPIGGGFIWYGLPSKIPSNCRICDNSTLAIASFAKLYENLGGAWGVSGANMNIPDLRGRFPRGVDGGAAKDPDRATRAAANTGGNTGDAVGSVQGDAMEKITGSFSVTDDNAPTYAWKAKNATGVFNITSGGGNNLSGSSGGGVDSNQINLDTSLQARTSTETRPQNANVYFVIRVS